MYFRKVGIAALCLMFALVGCGGSEDVASSPTAAVTATPTESLSVNSPTAQAVAEEPIETPAVTQAITSPEVSASQSENQPQEEVKVYPEGMYKIGDTLPAGEYFVVSSKDAILPNFIVRDGSSSDAKTLFLGTVETFSIIAVTEGEYLDVKGCSLINIEYSKELVDTAIESAGGNIIPGTYKVGFHIPAGEYKIAPVKDAVLPSYTIYSDASRRSVKTIKTVEGQGFVTIQDGEYINLVGTALMP